jgi:hypothetical protein
MPVLWLVLAGQKAPGHRHGLGHVQHGKQLVFGPLAALHFGEDGRADQDFPARVLLAGYLASAARLRASICCFLAFSCFSFVSSAAIRSSMLAMWAFSCGRWPHFTGRFRGD